MAIASVAARGTGVSSTSGTSLTLTPSATVVVGDYLFLVIAGDNINNVDGDNSEISSVTDTQGNTWTKVAERTNGGGGAASGTTVSMWMTKVTTQLTTSDTVTVTYASAIVDKCCSAWEFSVAAGATLVASAAAITNEVNGANDFGSVSHSGLASKERLYFRGLAKEANSTTQITVSTSFTAITAARSRNNTLAQIVRGEFRINTSTGETSNPTLAVVGDTAGVFVALEEQAPATLPEPKLFVVPKKNRRSKIRKAATIALGVTMAPLVSNASGTVGLALGANGTAVAAPIFKKGPIKQVGHRGRPKRQASTTYIKFSLPTPKASGTIPLALGANGTAVVLAQANGTVPLSLGANGTASAGGAPTTPKKNTVFIVSGKRGDKDRKGAIIKLGVALNTAGANASGAIPLGPLGANGAARVAPTNTKKITLVTRERLKRPGKTKFIKRAPVPSTSANASGTVPLTLGANSTAVALVKASGTAPLALGANGTAHAGSVTLPIKSTVFIVSGKRGDKDRKGSIISLGIALRPPISSASGTVPLALGANGTATSNPGQFTKKNSVFKVVGERPKSKRPGKTTQRVAYQVAQTGALASGNMQLALGANGTAAARPIKKGRIVQIKSNRRGDKDRIHKVTLITPSTTTSTARVASGTAPLGPLGASGTANVQVKSSGSVTLVLGANGAAKALVKASGTAPLVLGANGTGSSITNLVVLGPLQASGTAKAIVKASGTPLLSLSANGQARVVVKGSGNVVIALGVSGAAKVQVKASGSAQFVLKVSGGNQLIVIAKPPTKVIPDPTSTKVIVQKPTRVIILQS